MVVLLNSLALGGLAQDWTAAKLLVQPGRAAGAVVLGRPIPSNITSKYGSPASPTAPSPGAEGKDTGSVVFGTTNGFQIKKGLLVKLNDGHGDNNVYSIYVRGLRAYTPEGAVMGMTRLKAMSVYPGAQVAIDAMTGEQTLTIPGLTMVFANERLVEMVVSPK